MPVNFSWTALVTHVVTGVFAYLAGLFTPPPGGSK